MAPPVPTANPSRGAMLTEFTLPPTDSRSPLGGIVAGPDGALWFMEQGKIGRITTAGTISEAALPTHSLAFWGITRGPDGHLWVTEGALGGGGKIGRLTLIAGRAGTSSARKEARIGPG